MSSFTVEEIVTVTPESKPLWDGLAERTLRLQRCAGCGRLRFPPVAFCPYCSRPGGDWGEVEPRGTLYSWVSTHIPFDDSLAAELPYTVATVELDAGPRIFARLTDFDPDQLRGGLPVQGYFHREEGLPFLRFRPAEGG